MDFYWKAIGGSGWSPAEQFGAIEAGAPLVAQVGNSAVVTATDVADGPSDTVWFFWQTIGTTPWHCEVVTDPGSGCSA